MKLTFNYDSNANKIYVYKDNDFCPALNNIIYHIEITGLVDFRIELDTYKEIGSDTYDLTLNNDVVEITTHRSNLKLTVDEFQFFLDSYKDFKNYKECRSESIVVKVYENSQYNDKTKKSK